MMKFQVSSFATDFPKVIHQIWLGNKPIPDKCISWGKTFKEINPNWDYRLWTDNDLKSDAIKLENYKIYDSINNYGFKSDILRYEILLQYGGLYVDVDTSCCKPIDSLLKQIREPGIQAFAAWEKWTNYSLIGNGILGCTKNAPVIANLISQIPSAYDRTMTIKMDHKNKSCFTLHASGPKLVTMMFSDDIRVKKFTCKLLGSTTLPETFVRHYLSHLWLTSKKIKAQSKLSY